MTGRGSTPFGALRGVAVTGSALSRIRRRDLLAVLAGVVAGSPALGLTVPAGLLAITDRVIG
jgi:hypothetical protein